VTGERRLRRSEGDMIDTVVRVLEDRNIAQIQAIYSEPGAYGCKSALKFDRDFGPTDVED
jgi:hypothetical protein